MNFVGISGRLTRDPQAKIISVKGEQKTICSFDVANNAPGKRDSAVFVHCTAWEKLAECILKYCKKGSRVLVEGSLIGHKNKDGLAVLSVQCNKIEFLSPKQKDPEEEEKENPEAGPGLSHRSYEEKYRVQLEEKDE